MYFLFFYMYAFLYLMEIRTKPSFLTSLQAFSLPEAYSEKCARIYFLSILLFGVTGISDVRQIRTGT